MKQFIFCVLFLFTWLIGESAIRLPSVLASGMVLQRNSVVKIWGWADRGEVVTVNSSWLAETVSATAGADGKWLVSIPSGPAGGPHTMTIRGTNEIILNDILFGDVWICSGQSNMEFTIKMLGGWKKYRDEKKDLKKNDYSLIRLCQIAHAWNNLPQDSCKAAWVKANTGTVDNFSATAWFFGRELFNMLHVPIGLVSACIGGTPAESWTDRACLETDKSLNYFLKSPNSIPDHFRDASVLYNAMIHPLLNFRIKGAIWYQGESNRLQADLYENLFSTMIRNWRTGWGEGDFPFYFVQIAPFDYGEKFNAAAYLRESQYKTLSVPATGMAVTMDIGNTRNIHPHNKQDVGLRLALLALAGTYGLENVFCKGPEYKNMTVEGNSLRLNFTNVEHGLMVKGERLTCFKLAGRDNVFYPADARIDGKCVVVSCKNVPVPVSVRYAFSDTDSVNLFNLAGLPAVPFRTDSLPFFVRPVAVVFATDSLTGLKQFSLKCPDTCCQIRYTLDGTDPNGLSELYRGLVVLNRSCSIVACAFKGNRPSALVSQSKYTLHAGMSKPVAMRYPPDKKFSGGNKVLLDGIEGSKDFTDGYWQGYLGVDFDATIDLGDTVPVMNVCARFMQNPGSWIFLPTRVEISVSADGTNYTPLMEIKTTESQKIMDPFVREYRWSAETTGRQPLTGINHMAPLARFIRVFAKNTGVCPKWHPGKGGKAWLFTDEIIINSQ